MRKRSGRWSQDAGAAAVEFALVGSILFLIIIGGLQFGLSLGQWLELTHAAREGARWAALGSDEGVIDAKVIAASTPITPKDIKVECDAGDWTQPGAIGHPVTVVVTYDPTEVTSFFGAILEAGGVTELRSSATMRVE